MFPIARPMLWRAVTLLPHFSPKVGSCGSPRPEEQTKSVSRSMVQCDFDVSLLRLDANT
jgi:hypothetical protein